MRYICKFKIWYYEFLWRWYEKKEARYRDKSLKYIVRDKEQYQYYKRLADYTRLERLSVDNKLQVYYSFEEV